MANEVVITYWKTASNNEGLASGVYGVPLGGEVTNIGTKSAAMSGNVARLTAKGTGFWFKVGDTNVSAAANTDGNGFLAAGEHFDVQVTQDSNYIDTAADA